MVPFVLETGGRVHADSLGSLNELVGSGGAVREQMTRGSLESVDSTPSSRAEVWLQVEAGTVARWWWVMYVQSKDFFHITIVNFDFFCQPIE